MDAKMREQLLKIIETNALLGTEDLAVMLGTDEADVQDTIHELEERHITVSYTHLDVYKRQAIDEPQLDEILAVEQDTWRITEHWISRHSQI